MKSIYFSHDENARNDPKMIRLRTRYGIEGYGCFFALLEMISEAPEHALEYNEEQFATIAYDLRVSFDIKEFIDKCVEFGLFCRNSEKVWSESFDRRLAESAEKTASRSNAAKAAAAARWKNRKKESESNASAMPTHSNSKAEGFTLDGIDTEWLRVVQAYESNIGLIPYGASLDKLTSYYDDMGADVLIEAVKITNLAQAGNPIQYLCGILENWIKAGVDSIEKARAASQDHERKIKNRKQATANQQPQPAEQPSIRGKFY